MKDIFIDSNVIPNFANPVKEHYKSLIKWLLSYDEKSSSKNAYLAISNKLRGEYSRSLRNCFSSSNAFVVIIDIFTRQGRFNPITNTKIRLFKQKYFKKHIVRNLRCNHPDRNHIPVVMLSDRKYALSLDKDFCWDINNFPRFRALAVEEPKKLPYDN